MAIIPGDSDGDVVSAGWFVHVLHCKRKPASSRLMKVRSGIQKCEFPRLRGCSTNGSQGKVGIETGKVDGWVALVKEMNGVDFKVMPVGTAIQMPC